jgi:hypothetical protein
VCSRDGRQVRTETLQSGEIDFVEGWEEEALSERGKTIMVTSVGRPDRKLAGTTYRPERVGPVSVDRPWDGDWYPLWSWPKQKKYEARCGGERKAAKERVAKSWTTGRR